MKTTVFEELEEKYTEVVKLMPDVFNSHEFIMKLAQEYQKLYVKALSEYANNDKPFQSVHRVIAKKLRKREDLVKYIESKPSKNIFGYDSDAAIWQKVKK